MINPITVNNIAPYITVTWMKVDKSGRAEGGIVVFFWLIMLKHTVRDADGCVHVQHISRSQETVKLD